MYLFIFIYSFIYIYTLYCSPSCLQAASWSTSQGLWLKYTLSINTSSPIVFAGCFVEYLTETEVLNGGCLGWGLRVIVWLFGGSVSLFCPATTPNESLCRE